MIFCWGILLISSFIIRIEALAFARDNTDNVCLTKECVITAGKMLSGIDDTVNPCEDFFGYSCNNWIKDHPIPETSSSWGEFNVLGEKLQRNIRYLLEKESDDEKSVKMAKQFYAACMAQKEDCDTDSHKKLDEVATCLIKEEDLGTKLGIIRRTIGGNYLFSFYVYLDMKNATVNAIYVDQPSLGMDRAFYVAESDFIRKAYRKMLVRMWKVIFPEDDNAQVEAKANKIVEFEVKLANASTAPEDRRDQELLYNPMNIRAVGDLTSELEAFNWVEFLRTTFAEVLPNHDFSNERIIVGDVEYFKKVGKIVSSYDSSFLRDYLVWRIIFSLAGQASLTLRNIEFDYVREISGKQNQDPRWKVCTSATNSIFDMAVSSVYVKEFFNEDKKQKVDAMVGNIQEAFYGILTDLDWMDDNTKAVAKDKAKRMLKNLGYPDWILNRAKLEEYYDGLELTTPANHFKNYLDSLAYGQKKEMKEITKPRDLTQWVMPPTMAFPAGILQVPFFGMPLAALNYGGIGAVIGHEQSHGFDDQGRQYDADGNLADWWPQNVIDKFKEKAQCLVDQYGSYFDPDANITLNGINTLGENIADNSGIKQALLGYRLYVEKNGPEQSLPGMNYTSDQIFFLSFSQIWCGSFIPQALHNYILTNVHSPSKYRVKGVVANSEDFARAWNCPMPEKPCKVW